MTSIKPRKKPATKTATTQKKTRTTRNASAANEQPSFATEERMRMIREAAYFKAAERNFSQGDPVQDWVEAEAEIDSLINS